MLRRNLLYTAITRSKEFLILCGEESAFRMGVEREDDQKRKTTLYDKLVENKEASEDPIDFRGNGESRIHVYHSRQPDEG